METLERPARLDTPLPPIHDLVVLRLTFEERPSGRHLPLLRWSDHLLRRFALAEAVRIAPGDGEPPLRLRAVADEVWALVEGQVEFVWQDKRPASPTHGARHRLVCREPTAVLAPFGVAFGVRALEAPALLLRLASHEDGEHEGDRWLAGGGPA